MTNGDHGSWLPRLRQFARSLGVLCALASTSGCGTTNEFRAVSLPPEWQAQPQANVQTIDLTHLASRTIQQDVISREDLLEISIAAGHSKEDIATFPARVGEDGSVNLQYVGPVPVEGLSIEQAERAIVRATVDRGYYISPIVTVAMLRPKEIQVTVVGGVEKPGVYPLRQGSADVLQALLAAGGLSEEAGTNVEVRHPGFRNDPPAAALPKIAANGESLPAAGDDGAHSLMKHETTASVREAGFKSVHIDLASLTEGSASKDRLMDGTVVMVERRDPPPLQVLGLVRRPNTYDFPIGQEVRVLKALALAGGLSNPVANDIVVIRQMEDQPEPARIKVSYMRAKRNGDEDIVLQPGDTVSVERTAATVVVDVVKAIGFNVSSRGFGF